MRRRTTDVPNVEPPARLRRFDRADWDAEDLAGALGAWSEARAEYEAAFGWPGGVLARIKEQRAERRRAWLLLGPGDERPAG